MRAHISHVGQVFGRLTALECLGGDARGHFSYRFRCDCGNETVARLSHVKSGQIRGCGCLIGRDTKHGHWTGNEPSAEWLAWHTAKNRCTNPNNQAWADYGGRGIRMCDHWLEDFGAFIADMGLKPSPKHTLDRVKNDQGYEPGNCAWRSWTEQNRNKRGNRIVEYDGREMCVAELVEVSGCPFPLSAVIKRLNRGWSVEAAVSAESRRGY
jgi:hypothetical protein